MKKNKTLKSEVSLTDIQKLHKDADKISQKITLCTENLMRTYPDIKHRVIIGNFLLNMGLNVYTQTLGIEETHHMLALTEHSLRHHLESIFGNPLNPPTLH
jgi:hypothetical protein